MWMSELAATSGLPVPTIKYYLRERLLPPGEAVGATRARYDQTHVRRLRLVRALTEVAGLRLEDVRRVVEAIEDTGRPLHDVLGSAHTRLPSTVAPGHGEEQRDRVDALLDRHGWVLDDDSPHRDSLAGALAALAALGRDPVEGLLDVYADSAEAIARVDLATMDWSDRENATEHVVIGTLLLEPVLLTLRRIAQENVSRRRDD
jgi:DNA-binding transcriptional MerR regulator